MRTAFIPVILALLILNACKNKTGPADNLFENQELRAESKEIMEVVYSMYLPTDMTGMFNRSGTNYNPDIPAPIDDITMYDNPEQLALMLGVYGVDITYMKFLGQAVQAAQYYNSLETISQKLNIPRSIFEQSSQQIEESYDNLDSLTIVLEEIYRKTDRFFRENGNDNLAALSLTGGWLEAMYIGVKIFEADTGNHVIAEHLLQQKYTLNSIYTILSNHQESLSVKGYLLMLKKLRKVYEDVDIMYQKEGFSVDTTQKKLRTYNTHIRYDKKTMTDLTMIIPRIREEFIRVGIPG
ncbi:MAG: hypothetical protein WD052_05030 [Bacteroidales bacterium]